MRSYRSNAASDVRIEYGIELGEGLALFPETASAASEIDTLNGALAIEHDKRRALRIPVLRTRAALRFAEFSVERVVRSALRAAEIEDGGRRARICASLFPKGSNPILKPVGKKQLKPLKDLVERLEKSKVAGIDAYRAVWLPKLKDALASFETAVAAHLAALSVYDDVFKTELALRDAHHDAVDRIMGQVRTAFPRDRALQDVLFPPVDEADTSTTSEDDAEEPIPSHPLPPTDA